MRGFDFEPLERLFKLQDVRLAKAIGSDLLQSEHFAHVLDHSLLLEEGGVRHVKVEERLPHLGVADRLVVPRPQLQTTAQVQAFLERVREEGMSRNAADAYEPESNFMNKKYLAFVSNCVLQLTC